MMRAKPTILWDFDGTLVRRSWRSALIRVLDEHQPGHNITEDQVVPFLREGFPWHQPDRPHHHLSTPEAWWGQMEMMLAGVYRGVGFDDSRARELARLAHQTYINPQEFILYDDTIPALESLSRLGWQHAILSNHVPELPEIVRALPLSPFISFCITSAAAGYEKPNIKAFRNAISVIGNPELVWMVGDSATADVGGAEAAGLPAIQVRSPRTDGVKYYAPNLLEAAAIIGQNSDF